MDTQKQNDYYNLISYLWWSLVLTLTIFYLLIPIGQLELHDWPVVFILFFVSWYMIYIFLVAARIFIWDRIS
jgi:hypothetical protein